MSSPSYLNRETFNVNINEIFKKSNELNHNWQLIETKNIAYLEKTEQHFIDNDIQTFVYHIVYSESFEVPVFYLNAFKSNGLQLNYDELYAHFKLNDSNKKDNIMILSQQEHPILFKPFYFLHPCKTAEWMATTNSSTDSNYTLKWLSFVFFTLNISFDYLKYIQ